jgi:hypothetical protein
MNSKKVVFLFRAICISLLVTSCAFYSIEDKAYQACVGENCIKTNHSYSVSNFGYDSSSLYDKNSSDDKERRAFGKFDRATLEYDNEGNHFPSTGEQKEAITSYLNEHKHKNIFIVVYIHGWHHNAKSDNPNYKNFDDILIRNVNQIERLGVKDYKVLGIYVGWQAEIDDGKLLTYTTIGNRADVANKIGEGSLPKDLKDIADAMRGANHNNKMLVMGHSLGGRILTKAFVCTKQDDDNNRCSHNTPNFQPLGDNTLIVTINPAVDAATYRGVFSQKPSKQKIQQTPTWINFTSEDDWVTKCLYPLAQNFCLLSGDPGFLEDDNPIKGKTIGHYSRYHTHRLFIDHIGECGEPEKIDPDGCVSGKKVEQYSSWHTIGTGEFFIPYQHYTNTQCNPLNFDYYRGNIKQVSELPGDGRFWNVYTDRSVIDTDEDSVGVHNGYVIG